MKYIIGTGYFATEEQAPAKEHFFTRYWWENTQEYTQRDNPHVYIINGGGRYYGPPMGSWVNLDRNLGHIHHMIHDAANFPGPLCGWSMSVILLALIAYHNRCDLIYKEQDCLAFGPWVDRLYADCEGKNMVTGQCRLMKIEQSLFLIKYEFLLEYVRQYLAFPISDAQHLPEFKFDEMIKNPRNKIGHLSFGYGRDRPIDYNDGVFYLQQITAQEIGDLENRGLL